MPARSAPLLIVFISLATAGFIGDPNYDRPYGDLPDMPVPSPSAEDCMNKCQTTVGTTYYSISDRDPSSVCTAAENLISSRMSFPSPPPISTVLSIN